MKIICSKSNLVKGVSIVAKAVPSKTTMPILECILIDATTDLIKFTANDMELEDAYIPRLERSEYDLMATHGEVVVRDDGTCEADGYCIPGTDGIATRDNEEIGFYVMERVDANHIRVFVR